MGSLQQGIWGLKIYGHIQRSWFEFGIPDSDMGSCEGEKVGYLHM